MRIKNYPIICFLFLFFSMSFFACSKMNGTYEKFLKSGVIIYPGKADSLTAHSGNGRIELLWMLSDPKVTECRVYWNQGNDSLNVPIKKVSGIDTIKVIINNLKEGTYSFTVYSYDNKGHTSVGSEAIGTVYGEQYSNVLVNRFIKNMKVVNGQLVIAWSIPDDGTIGEEISYKDKEGKSRKMFVPVTDSAKIKNMKPGDSFQYRTLYLPDSTAIDTFYTGSKSIMVAAKLFEVKLDKSLFKAVHLPTDTYKPHSSANPMDKIWDGILNTNSHSFLTDPGTGFPQWFTFDLGAKVKLTRMKIYQRGLAATRLYHGGNVKKFEIWGSNDPNPDGSWGSWTLLLKGESKKPSGSPPGELTQEDIYYALAGEEYIFRDSIPAVRYIRFKTLENWDTRNRTYTNIGELTFWKE